MKQSDPNENKIVLHGRIEAPPVFSHSNHGQSFHIAPLTVKRLSGTPDRVNVAFPQSLLDELGELSAGDELSVEGEVRTYNNRAGTGSRLIISVLARTARRGVGEDENRLSLSGTLCKPPTLRATPLGRSICDIILAVNRRYGRADYLPCIAWGSLAHRCGELTVGQRLSLEGRLQSRAYTKVLGEYSEERTAYEVSVMSIRPEE